MMMCGTHNNEAYDNARGRTTEQAGEILRIPRARWGNATESTPTHYPQFERTSDYRG